MLCALIRETLKVDPKRENTATKSNLENGQYRISVRKEYCFDGEETYLLNASELQNVDDGRPVSVKSDSGKTVLVFDADMNVKLICNEREIRGYYQVNVETRVLTVYWGNKDIRHIIFFEEAHNLIGPESEEQSGADADPKVAATAFVVKMLAEVRALKEGIVIADQLPTVMAQEVLKNTGLKIGLRITSADDRSILGSTMAASAMQLEQMSTFAVGEALIFYEKLMRPFTMRIKEWWGEIEDRNEKEAIVTSKNDADLRAAIKDLATYQDENLKSIKIIGNKYHHMLMDIDGRIENSKTWLSMAINLKDKYTRLWNELNKYELGQIQFDEETTIQKYDQLEELDKKQKGVLNDSKKIKEFTTIIDTLSNWVFSLERLKKGRWHRFGAPELEMKRIAILQSSICGRVLPLYRMLVNAIGNTNEVKSLNKMIKELFTLETQLNEDLSLFIKANGSEVLNLKRD